MTLLRLLDINLAFGAPPVLEDLNLQIDAGERVCLLGRNGAGKSSLMRVVTGALQPDSGEVFRPAGTLQAMLPQEVPVGLMGAVRDVVGEGMDARMDAHEEEWQRELRLDDLLARLSLDATREFSELSGGLKRRVLLARALAGRPDLLLLDEPTNHLDLDSILWLESFLLTEKITLLFVTHDRAFLRKLATRIIELDRGHLTSWGCDYDTYLVRKEGSLLVEEKQASTFDKKLEQEEAWLRRGVKARRTRNEGRVKRLKEMRMERGTRRLAEGRVNFSLGEAAANGHRVFEAVGLDFAYESGEPLICGLNLRVDRGDKLGLIGPNGAGKSTLVKLLLGQLSPIRGELKTGARLNVAYFDQMRDQIDGDRTVADNIADGNETVTLNGRTRHVMSYLRDFLFEPDRARTPARVLSGGERNRLLLARLFIQPANVLVLDEPTNDLDAETLDLLENLLVEYQGTLLVVSHDRDFLDNVVSSTLVFEGTGRVSEYVGGYSDWMAEKARREPPKSALAPAPGIPEKPKAASVARKLSNREREELRGLPAKIEVWEEAQSEVTKKLGDPQLYKGNPGEVERLKVRMNQLEADLEEAYERWDRLESM